VGKISVVIGAKAPAVNSDFSIGIAKKWYYYQCIYGCCCKNQSFQIILNTEVDLVWRLY
jgi:hypothetical protein